MFVEIIYLFICKSHLSVYLFEYPDYPTIMDNSRGFIGSIG